MYYTKNTAIIFVYSDRTIKITTALESTHKHSVVN
jgi:hypothetical protein